MEPRDLDTVRRQLDGRTPRGVVGVTLRCPHGKPAVIINHPVPEGDGPIFPTTFWLTCPALLRAVGKLESDGAVGLLTSRLAGDPELNEAMERAHEQYASSRIALCSQEELEALRAINPEMHKVVVSSGVGGSRPSGEGAKGIKCLHAHYSHFLSGGPNPAGEWVAQRIGSWGRVIDERECSGVCGMEWTETRRASIDIGTNSVRLLVADLVGSVIIREVKRDMRITRLGKGVDRTGKLDPVALERTAECVGDFVKLAEAEGASDVIVFATSAARDAENSADLIRRVEELSGRRPVVLPGREEARLSFLGALSDQEVGPDRRISLVDIGGGSTEVICGDTSGTIYSLASVDVGAVRMTEMFLTGDPVDWSELDRMKRRVREILDGSLAAVRSFQPDLVMASGGTATTVAAIDLKLADYDRNKVQGYRLSLETIERVLYSLASKTLEERRMVIGLQPAREDVIVAGTAILHEICLGLGVPSLTVSDTDILQGALIESASRR